MYHGLSKKKYKKDIVIAYDVEIKSYVLIISFIRYLFKFNSLLGTKLNNSLK